MGSLKCCKSVNKSFVIDSRNLGAEFVPVEVIVLVLAAGVVVDLLDNVLPRLSRPLLQAALLLDLSGNLA